MKFALPVVYLALSIPTAVVAALQGGGGGGGGSIQAEKPTSAEAVMAKAARSPKIKVRCFALFHVLHIHGMYTVRLVCARSVR